MLTGAAERSSRPTPLRRYLATWRALLPRERTNERLSRALAAEVQDGLGVAFAVRTAAVLAIALWLPLMVPAPRVFYYLGFVAGFFVLGLVPHLLRRHRRATLIQLVFALLDVVLVTTAIIARPPEALDVGWPVQMRLRFSEYLYLILLLAGSALSYSPLNVIWTGLCIIVVWSAGVLMLYFLPDTVHFGSLAVPDPVPPDLSLEIVLSPTFVGLSTLLNQIVLTAIATGLLATAVARARATLLRQASAEVARADLARYVSPDVADRIINADLPVGTPANREVAVLVADIVGFTGISERLSPDRTVLLLQSFHERSCRVVFAGGGTLDKYMGDGFLATFGALADDPEAAANAVRCALDLQAEMDRWNSKRAGRGAAAVQLAIGVHCGNVFVGNIGSDRRLDFTVIGDAVNVASRLERLNREQGSRIAASASCLADARSRGNAVPAFSPVGAVRLPGREEPVEVCVWPAGRAVAG